MPTRTPWWPGLRQHEAVQVEGHFPVEGLRPKDLKQLCIEVGELADRLGTRSPPSTAGP